MTNIGSGASAVAVKRAMPKKARRSGPGIRLRFRTMKEINDVRQAAKANGLSMNTYILTEVLATARNFLSYQG